VSTVRQETPLASAKWSFNSTYIAYGKRALKTPLALATWSFNFNLQCIQKEDAQDTTGFSTGSW